MNGDAFAPTFEALPDSLPIFPLPGALLLPGGRLPLNIFEPRYLSMVIGALGEARMIGMVQPRVPEPDPVSDTAALYETGCAGRIVSFAESDDGRFLITLAGVCRFRLGGELPGKDGYRRMRADWGPFRANLDSYWERKIDRDRLTGLLGPYFQASGVSTDWRVLEGTKDTVLVTSLAMMCPFHAREKQALLEAADLNEVSETMMTLMEMALNTGETPSAEH